MRYIFLILFIFSSNSFAACNHYLVNHSKKLACVTVHNATHSSLYISNLNAGFRLNAQHAEETTLIPPGNTGSVKIVPDPILPHLNRILNCEFPTADAKKNRITIIYAEKDFIVYPAQYATHCKYIHIG